MNRADRDNEIKDLEGEVRRLLKLKPEEPIPANLWGESFDVKDLMERVGELKDYNGRHPR